MGRHFRRVRGTERVAADLIQQVDDRAYADGGGDDRGDLHLVYDASRIVAADDQLRHTRSGTADGLRAEHGASGESFARDFKFVRFRRAECLPRTGRGAVLTRTLVIGGRRGIGAAVVQALAGAGFAVTYTYRTEPGEFP